MKLPLPLEASTIGADVPPRVTLPKTWLNTLLAVVVNDLVLDANGQKIGEQVISADQLKNGRLLWLTGENAKIDSWEPAKLDVFTEVINVAVKHIASQTQTPIHYIMGELGNVNGETLTAT